MLSLHWGLPLYGNCHIIVLNSLHKYGVRYLKLILAVNQASAVRMLPGGRTSRMTVRRQVHQDVLLDGCWSKASENTEIHHGLLSA